MKNKKENEEDEWERGKRELDYLFKVISGEMTIREMRKELGDTV